MKRQLSLLRERLPVLLDPALRRARAGASAQPAPAWHLPRHAHSRVLYTFSGTAAVYQAVKALGLVSGDTVLIPSYNCGHEIEPVLRAGVGVRFFRVDARMQIDLEHLEGAIDRQTRAVLVTHYFGVPQPVRQIREICDRRGVALIEDCAHALFSRDGAEPLGLVGDVAVFSLRKTLPLPHGGALVCHNARLALPAELSPPPRLSTWPKLLERYQKARLMPATGDPSLTDKAAFVANRLVVDGARALRNLAGALGRTQLDPDDESLRFPSAALQWGMDGSALAWCQRSDPATISNARRRNYAVLLEASARFGSSTPAFPSLPAGICPLYFPVFARHPEDLVGRLARGAVASLQWWGTRHPAVPWSEFPEAALLKRQVVALPVHQDLGAAHMQRIAESLTER